MTLGVAELDKFVEKLKSEVSSLNTKKDRLDEQIKEAETKSDKIINDAQIEARNIVLKAEAEVASLRHQLSEREKAVRSSEESSEKRNEEAKEIARELSSLNEEKKKLAKEAEAVEAKRIEVLELEHKAQLTMEQALTIAKDRGVSLDVGDKEKKKIRK